MITDSALLVMIWKEVQAIGERLSRIEADTQSRVQLLEAALRELAGAASVVKNSTDSSHWQRLYRAIEQAEELLDE